MNTEWLRDFPSKNGTITNLNIGNFIKTPEIPLFYLDFSMSRKFAGLYHIDSNIVTIHPNVIDIMSDEEFINLVLHEIGHATSKSTNRISRLWDNCPSCEIKEVSKLEEQIAEVISCILHVSIVGVNKVNKRRFVNYLNANKNKFDFPWGEVDDAIRLTVKKEKQEIVLNWSKKMRAFLAKTNILKIKEGVFNGT
jgi:hypothetical protein